ncbi:MAG: HAD family phosphatase [Alphaproteobacteria bacterium]
MTAGLPALIFDCDGVLVNSEPISNRVLCDGINDLGIRMSLDEVMHRYIGMTLDGVFVDIEKRLGRPLPEGWGAELDRVADAAFEQDLQPIDGIIDALHVLRDHGYDMAMASNGRRVRFDESLRIVGLADWFSGLRFSGTEVAHPKPAPDLFLSAADAMGRRPSDCIVIEDSLTGVRAARHAGMRVIHYAPEGPKAQAVGMSARTLHRMEQLPVLIAAISG